MKFTKMQGCGNDYIYVNCFEETVSEPSKLAVKLSDRHYGIGSDGLILIEPSENADAYMRMFNKDGSEGRMCGNGIRCVARYIYDHGIVPEDRESVLIETPSGLRDIRLNKKEGIFRSATVDMGIVNLVIRSADPIIYDGIKLQYTDINTGNPHAVFFIDDNPGLMKKEYAFAERGSTLDSLDLESIGSYIGNSECFPEGVNSEFVEIISRNEIKMRVWERGSGETLACGTGACASAVAGFLNGKLDSEVTVHLKGGDLIIRYDDITGNCYMTGDAEEVFTGSIDQ